LVPATARARFLDARERAARQREATAAPRSKIERFRDDLARNAVRSSAGTPKFSRAARTVSQAKHVTCP